MAEGTVLVTGARGFIAKHVVAELLAAGYDVVGTVRSAAAEAEVRAAVATRTDAGARLRFVEADLLSDRGWTDAVAGCSAVIHLASPFPAVQPRNADDIVRPAVDGTTRVLRAAGAAGVSRLVLTSSVVAIASGRSDKAEYDETDWSDTSFRRITPYQLSKTLAERAAWDFVRAEGGPPMVVLNPGQVFGPPLDGNLDTSGEIIANQLRGKYPMVARYGFPVVDVRDVALAHVRALDAPSVVGERIILADRFTWLIEIARWLAEAFPAYARKLPRREFPSAVAGLIALFVPELRTVRGDLDKPWPVSHAKAERLLGIQFRPAREAVLAMAARLIELHKVP